MSCKTGTIFHICECHAGDRPVDRKKEMLEVCIKSFTGCTDPGFCGFFSAADKKLVVATDTAFVPFEFNRAINTWALTLICGLPSLKSEAGLRTEADGFQWDHSGTANKNVDLALAGITITDERKKATISLTATTKAAC